MSKIRLNIFFVVFLFTGMMVSCSEDNQDLAGKEPSLFFTAEIYEGESATRGPESGNLARKEFDMRIYVALEYGQEIKGNSFLVPEEQPGILRSYQTEEPITWQSVKNPHKFYGWTLPWIPFENQDPYLEEGDDHLKDGTLISFDPGDGIYQKEIDGKDASFYEDYMEKFIGAYNGPVVYNENGEYVSLQFRHLVSKIYIENFNYAYIDENGEAKNSPVSGQITLMGLPARGFFYRIGENGPIIIPDPTSTQVTYDVSSKTTLYVCPNMDFKNISYRISSVSNVESPGDFLGDFSSISFDRDLNDWWVMKNMAEHPNSTPHTTLYAGETLTLKMTLRQTFGNYIAAAVGNWGTETAREGGAYPYPGFYNGNELKNMTNYFQGDYSKELEEQLFKNYGDQENGEYRLYNDIDGIQYGFKTGKKYVLNGMGHTLTINPYSSGVVKITRCYNIYISDGNGHTIYIDENFDIYTVAEDGSMTFAKHLDEIPEDDKRMAYDINLETGNYTISST